MSDTKLYPRTGFHRASSLIGEKVENPQGDTLGKIEDLVVDPGEGRVAAAIVSCGGFLGLGERLVAIPFLAFTVDGGRGKILLDIDKETLEHAPSFKNEDWPELIDRAWTADIYSYYGYPRYWQ